MEIENEKLKKLSEKDCIKNHKDLISLIIKHSMLMGAILLLNLDFVIKQSSTNKLLYFICFLLFLLTIVFEFFSCVLGKLESKFFIKIIDNFNSTKKNKWLFFVELQKKSILLSNINFLTGNLFLLIYLFNLLLSKN